MMLENLPSFASVLRPLLLFFLLLAVNDFLGSLLLDVSLLIANFKQRHKKSSPD